MNDLIKIKFLNDRITLIEMLPWMYILFVQFLQLNYEFYSPLIIKKKNKMNVYE